MTPQQRHKYHYEVVSPELAKLARLICEASGIEDNVLEQSRYQDLLAFYEQQTSLGNWHPALAEAMADFTAARDHSAAISYYRLALEQARELDDDTYTILIAMAETLFKLAQQEQAEACLRDGRAEALRCGDDYFVQDAKRILRESST
jgi:hypothetical protein